MNFSSEWEQLYSSGRPGSAWPWSDVVSYVLRYCKERNSNFKVLELGCGAGANIPFFKSLGVKYYGIEGSQSIVNRLIERYPEYSDRIIQGDFTQDIPFDEKFDLVIDRASLTHNTGEAISNCIDLVKKKLAANGKFIGIDWFSTLHSDYQLGDQYDDDYTRTNIATGQFEGVGKVHFSDRAHISKLFDGFELTQLEHKLNKIEIPESKHVFASWNFVAVKK
jgi:SAM-dependent methyltransferase